MSSPRPTSSGSVIHRTQDIDRLKTDSARDAVAALNPHVELVTHPVRIDAGNALDLISQADLAVDGFRQFLHPLSGFGCRCWRRSRS